MFGHKGFSSLVLLLLIVSVLGLVVGAYYLQKRSDTQRVEPSPATTVEKTRNKLKASVSPNLDQTMNWATYINTKYNYSFKYPNLFGIEQVPGEQPSYQEWQNSDYMALTTYQTSNNFPKSLNPLDAFLIRINANPQTPDGKPFKCSTNAECIQELLTHYSVIINKTGSNTRTILGKPIVGIESIVKEENRQDGQNQLRKNEYFVISNNGQFFVINLDSFYYNENDYAYIDSIYNLVLNSFQFSN